MVMPLLAVAPFPQGRQCRAGPGLIGSLLLIDREGDRRRVPEDEVHIRTEEVGGVEEDLPLDRVDVGVQEVQAEGEVLQSQGLGLGEVDPLGAPVFVAGQRGEGLGQPVGHQGEEGPLVGRPPGSRRLQAAPHLADPQLLPPRAGHMPHPEGAGPLELEGLAGGHHILGHVEPAVTDAGDTAGEAAEGIAIQRVRPAEVVDDVGGRAAPHRVPAGLGELVVLDDGAVLVATSGRSQIHACMLPV